MQAEVEAIVGRKHAPPRLTYRAVAKWVDGTMIDTVWGWGTEPATQAVVQVGSWHSTYSC